MGGSREKASSRPCAAVVLSGRRLFMLVGESNVAVHRDLTAAGPCSRRDHSGEKGTCRVASFTYRSSYGSWEKLGASGLVASVQI